MRQTDTPVTVALRIRPLNQNEKTRSVANIIKTTLANPKVVIIQNRGFSFDHVFIEEQQESVFDSLMIPVIDRVLEGINCSVIAYGQTGTGKTYTMGTDPQVFGDPLSSGLIPRTAESLFKSSYSSEGKLSISVSFLEIYNEEVFDLLAAQPTKLDVKGFQIRGLTSTQVENLESVGCLLRQGASIRHTRPTLLNCNSSRSHAIFTFKVEKNAGDGILTSELHMVDLAGSERAKRTGTRGDAFQEAICINRGLLELGNVIQSLSSGRHGNHVPYRNSLLTSVLHGSLQAHNMVAMIACVSPSETDMAETVNTLRFVEKSKKVIQSIEMNKIIRLQKESEHSHPHNIAVPPTSKIHSRYPFGAYNFQERSETRNRMHNRLASTKGSLTMSDSVCSHNSDDSFMSASTEYGSSISPIVKRCCEQIENSLSEKIENIVQTVMQKQRPPRMLYLNELNTLLNSPLCNKEEEMENVSNDRRNIQKAFHEKMLSEMKNIVEKEVKNAVTNTVSSTIRRLCQKASADTRQASLLCRQLDFDHISSTSPQLYNKDKSSLSHSVTCLKSKSPDLLSCQVDSNMMSKDVSLLPTRSSCHSPVEGSIDEMISTPVSIPQIFSTNSNSDTLLDKNVSRRKKLCIFEDNDIETCKNMSVSRGLLIKERCSLIRRSVRLSMKPNSNAQENNNLNGIDTGSENTPVSHTSIDGVQGMRIGRRDTLLRHSVRLSMRRSSNNQFVSEVNSNCANYTNLPNQQKTADVTGAQMQMKRSIKRNHEGNIQYPSDTESVKFIQEVHEEIKNSSMMSKNVDSSTMKAQESLYSINQKPSVLQCENLSDSYFQMHQESYDLARSCTVTSTTPITKNQIINSKKHSETLVDRIKKRRKTNFKNCDLQKSPLRRKKSSPSERIKIVKKLLSNDVRKNVHQQHVDRIMSILNGGCPRELEKLPTVGPKTASIICNYRTLLGKKFSSFEDLKQIPGLSKKFHEKFILANLIM